MVQEALQALVAAAAAVAGSGGTSRREIAQLEASTHEVLHNRMLMLLFVLCFLSVSVIRLFCDVL